MKYFNYVEWEALRDTFDDMCYKGVVPGYLTGDFRQIRDMVRKEIKNSGQMSTEIVDMISRTEGRFMEFWPKYQSLLDEELQRSYYEDDTDPAVNFKEYIESEKLRPFGY